MIRLCISRNSGYKTAQSVRTDMDTHKNKMIPGKKRERISLIGLGRKMARSAQRLSGIILLLFFTTILVFTGAAAAADFTITFTAGGGAGADYTQTIKSDTPTPLILNRFDAPSSEQYFLKWKSNVGGEYYADGQLLYTLGQNIMLEAVWTTAVESPAFTNSIISTDGYYRMTNDITLTSPLTLSQGVIAVIDLNGHILTGKEDKSIIKIIKEENTFKGRHLKLVDSAPSREHTPAVTYKNPVTAEIVTVNGGCITGGEADEGGRICVGSDCTFTMYGGNIVGNSANNGGGVMIKRYLGKERTYYGMFFMCGGTIAGNTAIGGNGGGVENNGIFTMTGGKITENSAENGGGVFVADKSDCVFSVHDTATVKNNRDSNVHLSDRSKFILNGDLTGTIMISKAKSTISGKTFGTASGDYRGAENIIYDKEDTPLYGFVNPGTNPYSLIWIDITPTTVTFMDGCSEYASIKCNRGSAFVFPDPPVKAGRAFSGWKDATGNWFCIFSGENCLFFTKSSYYNPDETWKYTQTALTLYAAWDEISPVEQHSICVCSTEHGAVSASYARATEGTEVHLTAFHAAGYKLKSWTVSGGVSVPSKNPTRFIMPDSDVSVSAVFEAESPAPGPEPEEKEMSVCYQTGESTSYSIQIPAELDLKKGLTEEAAISVSFTTPPEEGKHVVVMLTSDDTNPGDEYKFILKLEGDETKTAEYQIASNSSFGNESLIKTGDKVLSASKDTTQNLYFKLTDDPAFAGTYKGTVTFTAMLEHTQAEEASSAEGASYPEEDVNPINKT